jgi:hypothetical protein
MTSAAHARGSICKIWVSGVDRSGAGVHLDLPYGASSCVGQASNLRTVVARRAKQAEVWGRDATQLLLVLGL